ncbi:MAG TPA: transglutaminase family protein [Stellaceae bacterium]|jgi:transglutaminase-like putative cysteine protease|nr:transglutaminase family protein [Stellaceae bacterium]
MRYAVSHRTHYAYGAPVDVGQHMLRLTPLDVVGQKIERQELSIDPRPDQFVAFIDHFGNAVHYASVETMHEQFSVTLDAVVDVGRRAPEAEGPAWEEVCEAMRSDGFPAASTIAEFVFPSPLASLDEGATRYAAISFPERRPLRLALADLTRRIHRDFAYTPNVTTVSTSVAEIAASRRGVCQDFSHLMIAGLRGLGLPARYVSGYIVTEPPEGGVPRQGGDASHAWVSIWCGEALGWIEFDPTNDIVVENEHLVVAYGRDFSDVAPLRGVILGGGSHLLTVGVTVTALDPD